MIQVKVKDIQLWQANYRQGDVQMIARSIQRFGYNRSVSLWRDNVVIAGNHTVKALKYLEDNQADAPKNVIVGKDGDWSIEVTDVSHLDEQEAEAYAIADNRASDIATNDNEQLASLLSQLHESDMNLFEATGWGEQQYNQLLMNLTPLDPSTGKPIPPDEFDPMNEWVGMPEFEQKTIKPFHSIKIHFKTEGDMIDFAELLGQTVTDKTTYIYYPKQVNENLKEYQVLNES